MEINELTILLTRVFLLLLPGVVIGVLLMPIVINDRKPAVSTIAWLLAFVVLPYLGPLLYVSLGYRRVVRRVKRLRHSRTEMASSIASVKLSRAEAGAFGPAELATVDEATLPPLPAGLLRQARQMEVSPSTVGNHVEVLLDGAGKFPALMAAIAAAKHHIHLEYYIFQSDKTGTQLRDLLVKKAKEGVEVRVLQDGLGTFDQARGFFDELISAGGVVATFLPVLHLFTSRWYINFRNHRKIVVVDGAVGFLGGQNVGDEYSGLGEHEGWHDVHLKISGPAVHHLQEIFMDDWFFTTEEDLASPEYFPTLQSQGDQLLQIVASGPDLIWPTLHQLFFSAIAMAQQRVYILNPYFVPTESLISALIATAHRGVDVRVILPHEGDQRLVFYASRSYYEELLKAGVRIYEDHSRMVHGKIMLVDDLFGTVGSCNMDVRSFFLNFEINALLYSDASLSQLDAIFNHDLQQATEVTLARFLQRPLLERLAENTCRLMSPML